MAEEDAMELRAMIARWEALRDRWALDSDEEAGLLGHAELRGPVGDVASWCAPRMEQRMRLLVELRSALEVLLVDGRRVNLWLRRPLDSMSGMSPLEAMCVSVEWIRRIRGAALDFVV